MKKLNPTAKTLIALFLTVAILPLMLISYNFAERLYPNAILNLRREFLYIGADIKLIGYDGDTVETSLDEIMSLPDTHFQNSMMIVSADFPITDAVIFDGINEYKDTDVMFDISAHGAFGELSSFILGEFGEKLYITSAYRTQSEQQQLFDEKGSAVAQRPGESEHQTGLALDVAVKGFGGSSFLKTDVGKYINLYSWRYGFIIRYPEGKTHITKIDYEPWHIRYVGAPHAEYMSKNSITLEEYLASLEENNLRTFDKIPNYAVIKVKASSAFLAPREYSSCIVSPDNCGNYIITFLLG